MAVVARQGGPVRSAPCRVVFFSRGAPSRASTYRFEHGLSVLLAVRRVTVAAVAVAVVSRAEGVVGARRRRGR